MRTPASAATFEQATAPTMRAFNLARDLIRTQTDPADQIRTIGHVIAHTTVELRSLATMRLDAIARLRATTRASYGHIAAATGLSKARVAQLAAQASRRQLEP